VLGLEPGTIRVNGIALVSSPHADTDRKVFAFSIVIASEAWRSAFDSVIASEARRSAFHPQQ